MKQVTLSQFSGRKFPLLDLLLDVDAMAGEIAIVMCIFHFSCKCFVYVRVGHTSWCFFGWYTCNSTSLHCSVLWSRHDPWPSAEKVKHFTPCWMDRLFTIGIPYMNVWRSTLISSTSFAFGQGSVISRLTSPYLYMVRDLQEKRWGSREKRVGWAIKVANFVFPTKQICKGNRSSRPKSYPNNRGAQSWCFSSSVFVSHRPFLDAEWWLGDGSCDPNVTRTDRALSLRVLPCVPLP